MTDVEWTKWLAETSADDETNEAEPRRYFNRTPEAKRPKRNAADNAAFLAAVEGF